MTLSSNHSTVDLPSRERLTALRHYIKRTWGTLTRTRSHILDAAKDIKVVHAARTRWPVYISPKEDMEKVKADIAQVFEPEEFSQIDLRVLPAEVENIIEHGLLYVPYEYVVPGGRFNEIYGWDSYFIVLGLLRDGEIELARSMVDVFFYEIDHYGTLLNGNRTYMLGRSHPPLLTGMALRVFEAQQDVEWLKRHIPLLEQYYYYWTVPPHLNPATGLSHYNALGVGPAPEVVASEKDEQGQTHYDRVRAYYRDHEIQDYDVSIFYDAETDELTPYFYRGDRSMRESGFDITDRFGPFSADIIHYVPVCLNVLLYQMEQQIAEIYRLIDQESHGDAWVQRAKQRHESIDRFLWDEEMGMYFDYNFCSEKRRMYEFLTTFMPLWAGIASETQAKRLVEHLHRFEAPGGLLTSTHISGNQWDAPFGWAPLHYFAIHGLRRYGYHQDAKRLIAKFVTMVTEEYERTGTIFEKYDLERRSAKVSDEIHFGYSSNETGFGWTNGVIVELLNLYSDADGQAES